jgi:hypothetical protein
MRVSEREGKLREKAHELELKNQLRAEENWRKAQEKAKAKKPKIPIKPPGEHPIRDLFDTIKGLAYSGDLGHFGRQGKQGLSLLAITDPKKIPGIIKETFKQTLSEEEFTKFHKRLGEDPEFSRLVKDFKFDVPGMESFKAEEAFAGGKAESIPVLGKYYVRPSDRGYTGGMNAIRYALAKTRLDAMKKQGLSMEKNPEAYRSLARGLNVITQRGDFGPVWQQALTDVSGFLGAPRNRLSRMQQFQVMLEKGEAGKLTRRGVAASIGYNVLLFGALKAMYGDEIEFISDPERSDFLKIRKDNITVDPWYGMGTVIRSTMRPFGLATLSRDSKTGKAREVSLSESLGSDIGNMLAPGVLLAWELASGKDVRGYLKDRVSALWNVAPISIKGVKDIAEEGNFEDFVFALMEATGESTNVFNREKASKENERLKKERGIKPSSSSSSKPKKLKFAF